MSFIVSAASILASSQPASLADELSSLAGLLIRPGCQGRPLLVLKCGYLLDEDSSPDSERLQSLGDVDSGHSTAHSPIDTGPKSLSPTPLQQNGKKTVTFLFNDNFCMVIYQVFVW